jgi:uncharacterized protein
MAYNFGVWSKNVRGQNMLPRLLKLPLNHSIFLFGPRNTGKSTLLHKIFSEKHSLWIDLLDPVEEDRFIRHPEELASIVNALPTSITHIVIDEIQKVPKLLDVVHSLIESTTKLFVMTGSSARKLKQSGVNLLAGRAFVYHLFPFSFLELKKQFDLQRALQWGSLPPIESFQTDQERLQFLQAYTHIYLKEEISAEQVVRKLDPFRRFLEVSAQCNGKIINYSNLARDVGVDDKTIKSYFSILEDTLIGFFLEPFQHSFRKRLSLKSKFYYFDTGVVRSLTRNLTLPLRKQTSAYGDCFEHFVILECIKLASYYQTEFRFSYLKTKDDAEIDLVIERPGLPLLFLEIKSSSNVQIDDLSTFTKLTTDFASTEEKCEAICLSNDPRRKQLDHVTVFPWQQGLQEIFTHQTTSYKKPRKKKKTGK